MGHGGKEDGVSEPTWGAENASNLFCVKRIGVVTINSSLFSLSFSIVLVRLPIVFGRSFPAGHFRCCSQPALSQPGVKRKRTRKVSGK